MSDPFAPGTFTPAPGRGPPARMLATQVATERGWRCATASRCCSRSSSRSRCWSGSPLLDVVPLPEPRVDAVLAVGARARRDVDGVHQPGHLAGLRPALRGAAAARGDGAAALADRRRAAGRGARDRRSSRSSCSALLAARARLAAAGSAGLGGRCCSCCSAAPRSGRSGLLLGGTLRAELVLAVANIVWFVLLLAGGIVVPAGPAARAARRGGGAAAVRRAGRGPAHRAATGAAPGAGPVAGPARAGPLAGAALAVRTVRAALTPLRPHRTTRASWTDPCPRPPAPRTSRAVLRRPGDRRGRRAGRHRGHRRRSCGSPGPGWAARPGRSASRAASSRRPHPEVAALHQWVEFGNRLLDVRGRAGHRALLPRGAQRPPAPAPARPAGAAAAARAWSPRP